MEKLTLFINRVIAGTGFGIGMGSAFAILREYENIDYSKDIEKRLQMEIYRDLSKVLKSLRYNLEITASKEETKFNNINYFDKYKN